MKDEQFDKEISALYQQRKSQIVAPSVTLPTPAKKNHYSIFKIFSIFTVGGAVSFGILAIVIHLAQKPDGNKSIGHMQHQVDIADVSVKTKGEEKIAVKPMLPPKPELPVVKMKQEVFVPIVDETRVSDLENFELNMVQVVNLPQLKEPKLSIKPIYKVMPKYSYKALKEGQSGAIRLRYEIDEVGNVRNIDIINSEVSRELQRSATKALTQWRYKPGDNIQSSYEIIFEFNRSN